MFDFANQGIKNIELGFQEYFLITILLLLCPIKHK